MPIDIEESVAGRAVAGPSVADRLLGLVQAARPRQWIKNLACFAGLIFSGRLFQPEALAAAFLAFAGFCAASSGIYLINDVFDREADRAHPSKRTRPIASGRVPLAWALAAAVVLLAASAAITATLPRVCLVVLGLYLALNLAYSARLKHSVLLDVMLIALGFVLRVFYGVYAVRVLPSAWIALCMFFLALFLGFAKRRCELEQLGADGHRRREVLRKYPLDYLDLLLAMTATMAILCYVLYTIVGRPHNHSLVVTVPLVVYGIIRYLLLVMAHGVGEAPDRFLVTDRVTIATVLLWAALCVALLYGQIDLFLRA